MDNLEIKLPEPLLKATDVAEILNVSRAMAYKLMKIGEIRTVEIGYSRRVRVVDLLKFIESNITPS